MAGETFRPLTNPEDNQRLVVAIVLTRHKDRPAKNVLFGELVEAYQKGKAATLGLAPQSLIFRDIARGRATDVLEALPQFFPPAYSTDSYSASFWKWINNPWEGSRPASAMRPPRRIPSKGDLVVRINRTLEETPGMDRSFEALKGLPKLGFTKATERLSPEKTQQLQTVIEHMKNQVLYGSGWMPSAFYTEPALVSAADRRSLSGITLFGEEYITEHTAAEFWSRQLTL